MTPGEENAPARGPDRPVVRCRTIRVGEALGIRPGDGLALDNLSPGITLVLAPNGTGKTTMARVLALLALGGGKDAWRQIVGKGDADSTYRRLDVDASFDVVTPSDGEARGDWTVKVIRGEVEEHRDGKEFQSPLPDLATASRYFIALPDLLVDGGAGFGRQIREQASGGIRWTDLRQGLGWAETPGEARSLAKGVRDARRALDEAKGRQKGLDERTNELPSLLKKRLALTQRMDRKETLIQAKEGRKRQENSENRRLKLEQFDARLKGFAGKESDELERLSNNINTARDHLKDCRDKLEILEKGAPAPLDERERLAQLDRIEGLVESFEKRHAEKVDAELEHAEAVGGLRDAAEKLADLDVATPPTDPGDLPIGSILDAGTKVSRAAWDSGARSGSAAELRQRVAALEVRWGSDQVAVAASSEIASEALGLLSQWLRQPRTAHVPAHAPEPRRLLFALIVVGLSIVASLIDAIEGSILAIFGIVFGSVVLVLLLPLCLRPRIVPPTAPEPDRAREEYERLAGPANGIPMPAEWAVEHVQALHAQLSKMVVLAERQRLLQELRSILEQLEKSACAAEKQLDEAKDALGKLVTRSNLGADEMWASTIAGLCADWLQSKQRSASTETKLTIAKKHSNDAATSVREALIEAGCIDHREAEGLDPNTARKYFESLKKRIEDRLSYEKFLRGPELVREEGLCTELAEAEEAHRRFLLEVPGGPFTEESLRGLCAQWAEYQKAKSDWSTHVDLQQNHAADHPEPADVQQLSKAEIDKEIESIDGLSTEASELSKKIIELEKDVRDAGDGKAVSNALSDLSAANLKLRAREIADLDTVIGQAVFEWARREAKTEMEPRVLVRARQLVAQFTAGKLDFDVDALEVREGEEFRARNGSEPWRPISRLSSGERVQLLLSVRLAFLEESESMRLPIILDEVLASSDDARAARVMDAVVDVAKSGRQVLYLSSQADEIEKWTARLEGSGVPCRFVRLAEARAMDAAQSRPARQPLPPERTCPDPEGCTRAEYAERISVPGIDWLDDRLDSLHLWYVLPGLSDLYRQLIAGIETLGQLERLATVAMSASAQEAFEQSRSRASGFRAAASALGVGRGKPLGPEVLDDCDAITNAFRARVGECLEASDGDSRDFLARVRELRGFRAASLERLEEWLNAGGYLVDGARMAPSEIRDAVDVAVRTSGIPEAEVPGIVDEVMAQLPKRR